MLHAGPFVVFARRASRLVGHPATFCAAVLVVVGWALSGPLFGFSDTWQLAVNTATTIVTFLTVFLIQNTQNRDGQAVQIKLDELIRATKGAHNVLLDLEELDERDLDEIRSVYERLAADARRRRAGTDTGTPEIRLREEPPSER